LVKALETQGTLEVIRRGVNVAGGGKLILCQSPPEDERNETVIDRYRKNRLRVVRQLKYAQDREWALDLAFFINGIPVATAELKSDFTQSVKSAMHQYRADRQPKDRQTGLSFPLLKFKEGLTKFVRMYEYISQLIEFSDPELEAFAGYARLLRNRLKGINPEEIDLKGLQMTHFGIKTKGQLRGIGDEAGEYKTLRPATGVGTAEGRDRERAFLSELIEKLNDLFGEGITEDDKVMFAVHISEKLRGNETVMAQVRNNTKEQALKADLPDAAIEAIVEAMGSHEKMATRLLSDEGARGIFLGLLYEMLKQSEHTGLISKSIPK